MKNFYRENSIDENGFTPQYEYDQIAKQIDDALSTGESQKLIDGLIDKYIDASIKQSIKDYEKDTYKWEYISLLECLLEDAFNRSIHLFIGKILDINLCNELLERYTIKLSEKYSSKEYEVTWKKWDFYKQYQLKAEFDKYYQAAKVDQFCKIAFLPDDIKVYTN